jgi:hypothetical protein
MQFLIITKQSSPPPPEMAVPLMEAMEAWWPSIAPQDS